MNLVFLTSAFYEQGISYLSPLLFILSLYFIKLSISKKIIIQNELFFILFIPLIVSFPATLINVVLSFDLAVSSIFTLFHQSIYMILSIIFVLNINAVLSKKLFFLFISVILFICTVQFIQYFFDMNVFYLSPTHASFIGHMGSFLGYGADGISFRSTAVFSEPGDLSMFISPLVLIFWNFLNTKERYILIVIMILILITNKSLSGYLALIFSFFLFNIKSFFNYKAIFSLSISVISIIYIFYERFMDILLLKDPSFNLRLLSIQNGIDKLMESNISFIFGFGLGNSAKIDIGDASIKSDYIRIFFESGIIGLSIYIVSMLYFLYKFRKNSVFIMVMIYFLVLGIFTDTIAQFYKYLFIAYAWKIGDSLIKKEFQNEKNSIYNH